MTRKSETPTEVFGRQLRELMKERGHVSAGARSGVDVAWLARAAEVSYEMARRYAEGQAYPRPDVMGRIAAALNSPVGQIAYSKARTEASIDEGELEQCLSAVLEAARRSDRHPSSATIARITVLLYLERMAGRQTPPESLDLLLRAI